MSNFELTKHLFLQLALIFLVCRCVVFLGVTYLKQTVVVCEMMAGILLGPSLLGLIAPEIKEWLFPGNIILLSNNSKVSHPSMSILYSMSQVGIALYMFLVGLELKKNHIKGNIKKISIICVSGILAPLLLGMLTTFFLYQHYDLFSPHINILSASLYLGIAISITAFPTLARMLHEKKMTNTKLGSLALGAGSIGDALAWCLLAIILSCIKENLFIAFTTIIGGSIYVIFCFLIGKNVLRAAFKKFYFLDKHIDLAYILILIMLCAWITDIIGIHSVFGAFILGLSMPRGRITNQIRDKIEPLTNSFLLPIFFIYSGLNTSINLLHDASLWAIAILIIMVAIVGKGVFCTLAARITGENWRASMAIGTLMNCRGLMELIILNIGLENNIITPTFFTIGVLMALVTTLMTSPLFDLIYRPKAIHQLA